MAQPLSQQDYASLLACLQNALNQNPEVQKQAEAYIQSLDSRPGFSSALAEIVSNRDADHSARYLASVHLKNSIHRNWKKRVAQAGITPEEKAHLRTKLAALIPQDDNQIAVQVALVYAKVARFDYPSEWPGLFSDLMANLGAGNPLTVRRVYLILHHVLKELSSKRLVADQAQFAQVTELLFAHVWGQWCSDTQLLLAGLPGGLEAAPAPAPQALLQSCERWMLLLKILRRLILHGFPSDARTAAPVAAVHSCCPHMVAALQGLLGVRSKGRALPRSHLQAMLDRALLKLLRTQCQVLEAHPWSFHGAGVLFPAMELAAGQLTEAAQGEAQGGMAAAASQERWLTQCCGLLVGVMQCKSYKGQAGGMLDAGSGQPKDTSRLKAMAAEVRAAVEAFWAAPQPGGSAAAAAAGGGAAAGDAAGSRLIALAGALVSRHMVLTRSDLEQWRDGPEEFAHCHGAGAWQDCLALAAEQLYMVLLQAYRDVLGPAAYRDVLGPAAYRDVLGPAAYRDVLGPAAYRDVLGPAAYRDVLGPAVVSLLPAAHAAAPPGVPADSLPGERVAGVPAQVLYKDAVYAALAAGAYELHEHLDYRGWLAGGLLQELADPSPANKPIRRRIGAVVAANVDRVPEDDPIRPTLYQAMLGLMAEGDAAVALSGIGALTALLGDFNFTEGPFTGALPGCLTLLLQRMGDTAELDTQKQAFGLLNMVIERCGEALRPHCLALAGALPGLWEAAAGQSLLRIQILEAVQRLLNLAGRDSPALYPLVMPLLGYSLDMRQPEVSEGLLEDGLALWLVALRNAPSCAEPDPAAGPDFGPAARLLPGAGPTLEALLAPLPALQGVAEASTEHLPLTTAILASAALLAGPALYGSMGPHVLGVLGCIVGNVSERGMLLALPALETLLQAAPLPAARALQPVLLRLLGLVLGGKESALVVTNSLPVFGRLLLATPERFVALCGAAAGDAGVAAALGARGREGLPAGLSPGEVVLVRLLELWAEQFDTLAQAGARRLCALALCRALALPSAAVLGLLELLLPAITGVWFETEGGGGPGGYVSEGLPPSIDYFSTSLRAGEDGLEEIAGPALDSEDAEGEGARRTQLREVDPATRLKVGAALREGLAAAASLHGPSLEAALGRLDEAVMGPVRLATGAAGAGQAGGAAAAGGQ
ncbi:hypothetical protein HYH03_015738 [Edaphochlamys debaryana]|uniref:Importin N-terminal domain-containing protein n=1 Tax=Edaphochlamys debaryana TaxID=47281 RepID=A0A836BQM7_9CHLO|nr:hypothetical protein HYH03_015738 [Edaphochlamys debaryana]|eukprot:KAG2485576.1 hypothetical protein HYH03_015738 [Edaphochlamys debaryana]